MNACLAIMAHEGAQQTVCDFYPQWEKLGIPIHLYVPNGHNLKGHNAIQNGPDARTGNNVVWRFMQICKDLLETDSSDLYILAEYDTLNLTDQLPDIVISAVNCGHVQLAQKDNDATNILNGQQCALSPWIVSRPMLAALVEALKMGMAAGFSPYREGLLDRMIADACNRFGVPMRNIEKLLPYPWIENPQKRIVALGKTWVHGWKTKEEFKELWPQ